MNHRRPLILMLSLAACVAAAQDGDDEFTSTFPLDRCYFVPFGGNAYFNLNPGRQTYFDNSQCVEDGECDEEESLTITVTRDVEWIHLPGMRHRKPVRARVVEEYETAEGHVTEISRNFFATCWPTGDVYYFGEDVDLYDDDGNVVSHEGAWRAGRDGAMPGIIMPGSAFLIGTRYYQEVAPPIAQDRAEHVATDLDVTVGAGSFNQCIEVEETIADEPDDVSTKVYCPGIGLVVDEDLEAVYTNDSRHW